MDIQKVFDFVLANQDKLAEIALGVIFMARLVAKLTPSKKDDEIAGSVELGFRKAIELLSGAGHKNLVVPSDPQEVPVVEVASSDDKELHDVFDSFQALVGKFGGKIVIVPKEKE